MDLIAQYSTNDYIVEVFAIAAILGVLVGAIASSKGKSFVGWWLFGTLLFLPAIIVVLLMPSEAGKTLPAGGPQASDIVWLRSGVKHLLGYTIGQPYYGIWDRERPGPPSQRFPYTEHGKSEAIAVFEQLEPNADVLSAPVPPPPT